MKKIHVYRENEYVAYANVLKINIGKNSFCLPVNSSVEFESLEDIDQISLKYLWVVKKINLNKAEKNVKIRIKPIVSNIILIISMLLFLTLTLITVIWPNPTFTFVFKIYGVSILMIFFFLCTIGSRFFFTIEKESY